MKAIENVNNQMHNTVSGEESLSPLEIAAKKYDKGAHSGQFAGEDPSYHFINGAEWQQSHSEPSGKEKSEVKGNVWVLRDQLKEQFFAEVYSKETEYPNYEAWLIAYFQKAISALQEQLRKNEGENERFKEALTLIATMKRKGGEEWVYPFNRCYHIATNALEYTEAARNDDQG